METDASEADHGTFTYQLTDGVNLADLPQELKARIFRHLTATDLCRVALCNRILRETANDDDLWHRLCQKQGWERYGTISDLCKEPPFKPTSKEHKTGEGGAPTFPVDAVVTGSDWPGLVDTCKWKEVYMKARHLEENWRNERFYTTLFDLSLTNDKESVSSSNSDNYAYLQLILNIAVEGDCLVAGSWHRTLEVWDMCSKTRQHLIQLDISEASEALKMKDGIVAAGCKDGKIRTFSAQTGEQLQVMSGHRLAVSQLFFDGETIVSVAQKQPSLWGYDDSVDADSDVWVSSAANGAYRYVLQSGHEATRLLHLDYKDKIVAGAYSDNIIRIWDARSGSCLEDIASGMNKLTSCHLGESIVIGASKDFIVKIWDLQYWKCIKTFDVPLHQGIQLSSPYEQAKYMYSDGLLIAVTLHNGLYILNLNGERLLIDGRGTVQPLSLKGNKLLTWSSEDGWYGGLWLFYPMKSADGKAQGSSKTVQYVGQTHVACAWMSDTKMVYQGLYGFPTYVSVRHYW
ncbi:probable E3 ubiquitin ligase complex SCF subunit sconB [Patiria miniata]|uniref:F-box domain-containing protein n=1 Tax=Patiria miniata TaxID=46514 RepID=A0A914AAL2_PATMI|nr:probable E3 ubiquitin ligase complex SCF subunit sconB [Patiria miniata]